MIYAKPQSYVLFGVQLQLYFSAAKLFKNDLTLRKEKKSKLLQ